ncbi:hypothetical protein [Geodermatophilus poikilotrophus]|uniref:Uncharacterized protein n=1 Tax=Geodermatophilus poikilotrophus TaxID=1333667 RepID=A0A1I0DL06_9ACTN|nr:hypothetical protein [Geodermatophilus poikilotrophus]SET33179.1 hypothetical protein SAMN04488546_2000 [Geodermatophilus poikilotrophus]
MTWNGAARPPLSTEDRADTRETAAAKLTASTSDDTAGADSSGRLAALVAYVIDGRDRLPLDRLCSAAYDGRAAVEDGADRVAVIAALTAAAEAAGVPRRVAEAVLRQTLRDRGAER